MEWCWLSKSSFLTYAGKTDYLGCTIGHELSHIVFNDHIKQSIKLSEKLKKLKDKKKVEILINLEKTNGNSENAKNEKDALKEVLEKELRRESEMIADNNAAKMLINTGLLRNMSEWDNFHAGKIMGCRQDIKSMHQDIWNV